MLKKFIDSLAVPTRAALRCVVLGAMLFVPFGKAYADGECDSLVFEDSARVEDTVKCNYSFSPKRLILPATLVAGAGLGILSANVALAMLPVFKKWFGWQRHDFALSVIPQYDNNVKSFGVAAVYYL